ncbi:MAG: sigma-54-dependent Fis family transcriptional regulator, partial [Desulfobacterales bacterium]
MGTRSRLSPEERDFFTLVNQAVFANPFGDARVNIDLKIAGLFPGVSGQERIDKAIDEIAHMIARLEREGRADINQYSGRDRRLIENSFLYDFFHKFIDRFDQHIREQIEAGEKPLHV